MHPRHERYPTPIMGARVIEVLDRLGIESAVVGGKTNGVGIALEAALLAPVRGVVLDSPWLEHSAWLGGLYWTPLWLAANYGAPVLSALGAVVRRLPLGRGHFRALLVDAVSLDVRRTAALHQGFFVSRPGPPPAERAGIDAPALVIAQSGDPFHGPTQAGLLIDTLPNSRLVMNRSWLGWFKPPANTVDELDRFMTARWATG